MLRRCVRAQAPQVHDTRPCSTPRTHVNRAAGTPSPLTPAPHTPQTDGLIGAAELALLPDRALVVNVARGRLVDTDALVEATASGRIRAALDVTDPEPLPADHPLWRTPGVLISPHVGGASSAFWPRADRLVAGQLKRFAAGEPLDRSYGHRSCSRRRVARSSSHATSTSR